MFQIELSLRMDFFNCLIGGGAQKATSVIGWNSLRLNAYDESGAKNATPSDCSFIYVCG